ncbi:coiled-coil domain-containing protein 150-like isoform X1 [Rhopilema esculentum]|uniref:coiled-coil domain-containing protein 150-like isoform X1 n=2 Tax=Rhopilema esculentum TaxID=499914 RepID=UPI0031DC17AD
MNNKSNKRIGAETPVEDTLENLQKRLTEAEKGATLLNKHLKKYGYKAQGSVKEKELAQKESDVAKAAKTGRKKAKEKLQLQKSFEEMTTRVCRMENALQSLKVGMHGIQDKASERKGQTVGDVMDQEGEYQNEIKKLEGKLEAANQEAEALRKRDKDIQKELEHLINDMKDTQDILVERDGKIADLEGLVEKVSNQKKETDVQLEREIALRQSLEDAHEALLQRIHDMETIVDSERGQVTDLVNSWDNAKKEAVATKEAFANEHELRVQLEGLLSQQEEDFGAVNGKFKQVLEEKKILENDMSQIKREGKSLRQQNEVLSKERGQLLKTNESLSRDCQKLQEALRIAATDNKALISQHKDVLQREKDRINTKVAMQDKLLDNAKDAIMKELEREKAAVRNTEMENVELKASLKSKDLNLAEKVQLLAAVEKKYKTELDQVRSLLEASRNDKEIALQQKNEKILELQRLFDDSKKENMEYQFTMKEMKTEIERLQRSLKSNKTELEHAKNRLNTADQNSLSQKQIEEAFSEIMQAKSKLAYENGLLQSKVEQLNFDLNGNAGIKRDYEILKEEKRVLRSNFEILSKEMQNLNVQSGKKDAEIRRLQEVIKKKGADLETAVSTREKSLKEAENFLSRKDSTIEKYSEKISNLENQLELCNADNKKLVDSFEAMMLSHSKMQANMEDLQITLGKKDSEIQNLVQERNSTQKTIADLQTELDNLQNKITSLEDVDSDELSNAKRAKKAAEDNCNELLLVQKKLQRQNDMLKDEVEKLKADIRRKVKQMEDDASEREGKEQDIMTKNSKEKEEIQSDYRRHLEKLKSQLRSKERELASADEEISAMKRRLKKQKDDFQRQRKDLENLKLKNQEQVDEIQSLVSQIDELRNDIQSAVFFQTQADMSSRQYENAIEKEKMIRMEAESRCMTLETKEKELHRKLEKASLQSIKASNELKQAQKWFQKKVEELEIELQTARQTQYLLEQTTLEQERLIESKSEDAKKLVQASRVAVSKAADQVAENLNDTRGLKQVLKTERSLADRAAQKYQRLMESSARKVEELAKELDRAHEKARKARNVGMITGKTFGAKD